MVYFFPSIIILYKKLPITFFCIYRSSYIKMFSKIDSSADISILWSGHKILSYSSAGNINYNRSCSSGDLIVMLCKEADLYTLIHEMAHIYNEDTLVSYKIIKSTYLIKNLNNIFISFGLNFLYFANIGHRVGEKMEKFLHFIKLEREKKADSLILEHGDKQEFINAISKTYIQTFQDQCRFNLNIFK